MPAYCSFRLSLLSTAFIPDLQTPPRQYVVASQKYRPRNQHTKKDLIGLTTYLVKRERISIEIIGILFELPRGYLVDQTRFLVDSTKFWFFANNFTEMRVKTLRKDRLEFVCFTNVNDAPQNQEKLKRLEVIFPRFLQRNLHFCNMDFQRCGSQFASIDRARSPKLRDRAICTEFSFSSDGVVTEAITYTRVSRVPAGRPFPIDTAGEI